MHHLSASRDLARAEGQGYGGGSAPAEYVVAPSGAAVAAVGAGVAAGPQRRPRKGTGHIDTLPVGIGDGFDRHKPPPHGPTLNT